MNVIVGLPTDRVDALDEFVSADAIFEMSRHVEAAGLDGVFVTDHPAPDDRLNLDHAEWRAPWDKDAARTESFPELFSRACAEAPGLMNAALNAMQGEDATEAIERIGARRMDARPV